LGHSLFVALVVRRLMTALQSGLNSWIPYHAIQVPSTLVTNVKHQNWLNQREYRGDSITPEGWLKVSDLFIWRHCSYGGTVHMEALAVKKRCSVRLVGRLHVVRYLLP
jgi:hypothetical protein